MILNIIIPNNLYPLSSNFLIPINIWISLFCFFSLLIQSLTFSSGSSIQPSQFARNLFYYISLLTFPFLLFKAYEIIQLGSVSNWMGQLRIVATGGSKLIDQQETSPFYIIIWLVSYLIELYYFSEKNKKRVYVLFLMYFAYALISMSKTNFLSLFLSTVLILYFKNIFKIKHIFIFLIALFVFFQGFQSFRSQGKNIPNQTTKFVTLYLLSSPVAFEKITDNSTQQWGENTFRTFYAIKYKLGFSDIKPVDQILPFIYIPISTNTYTILYPFFIDFGIAGVIFFSIFFGLLLGFIFKKSQESSIIFIIIYSFILPQIVMQFAGEMIITNLSLNLKRILIVMLPFIITKYNLFSKNQNKVLG